MGLKRVAEAIRRHKRFLITAHVDPEADAIGSQLALASMLRRAGKKAVIIDQDPPPISCDFLPGIGAINVLDRMKKKVKPGDFDCALVVDCPTLERTGKVAGLISGGMTVINVDHHISNTDFGDVNWVDGKSAATGEMVYCIFKKLRVRPTKTEAMSIYAAILIDTGSFRYSNTSARTHMYAAELMKSGLDTNSIYENLFEMKTYEITHLLGHSLATMRRSRDGKIVWLWITGDMLSESGADLKDAENFIGFARSVRGSKVAVLFKQAKHGGPIKVSLRGKDGIDVNKIASKFGGGGHAAAAGFSIKARDRASAEKKVISEISKYT
ncbi:MAG TPA: bifunctional oligoribonuclease/PAP phosphatase NrnA [Candidatus Omnitrophota bacterium]|nr:bifunctional oligoribonuclease/PAP phosphatase NrnA [Candidatus Omnitrophota bacterium]HOX09080.1 bifunctional oligoribonuclease/PAP phosphatase NrnA [Candidatus Omnitrophota bacterium]HRZ66840.1 bifunctional oligoribonuclease/PAP phosphatase NrnA [Candidatus Omnitrophota bacterium]